MSEGVPPVNAAVALRALEPAGFALARQSGSSQILKNAAGKPVSVAVHLGTILHLKLLKSILRDAGLRAVAFEELL